MLAAVLARVDLDESCLLLFDSSPDAARVAQNTIAWLTDLFPPMSTNYCGAAVEVLDLAGMAYLAGSKSEPDRLAAFMDAAVRGCTHAISHWGVELIERGASSAWDPWRDGPLCDWLKSGDKRSVTLTVRPIPSREYSHAIRAMLYQRMLTWTDMIAIGRAGIDVTSVDLL